MEYRLRYTNAGLIYMDSHDDCDRVVDIMLNTNYNEEFCVSFDWKTPFIINLMKAGFLVMSATLKEEDENGNTNTCDIALPKLHLVRSVLFFPELHIKKSIKKYLSRYELRFDTDFDTIVHKCIQTHGQDWLTPSLINALFDIKKQSGSIDQDQKNIDIRLNSPLPVSFSLYRNGNLVAGEFGVLYRKVYTSYSGYKEESNAGTVQMILMIRALEQAGCAFVDLGMPMEYKNDLGARDISPEEFVKLYRDANNP